LPKQDLVTENVRRAKELYLAGLGPSVIADQLSISKNAVNSWIKSGEWAKERDELDKELKESIKIRRGQLIPKAIDLGINLIYNAFQERMSEGKPLNILETKIVSGVISDIDKLVRLDAGDPTEIKEAASTIPVTLEELKKVIARDPFINTIELKEGIDYGTTTNKTEDNGASEQNGHRDIPVGRDPMAD
jgi:hypothetical protein